MVDCNFPLSPTRDEETGSDESVQMVLHQMKMFMRTFNLESKEDFSSYYHAVEICCKTMREVAPPFLTDTYEFEFLADVKCRKMWDVLNPAFITLLLSVFEGEFPESPMQFLSDEYFPDSIWSLYMSLFEFSIFVIHTLCTIRRDYQNQESSEIHAMNLARIWLIIASDSRAVWELYKEEGCELTGFSLRQHAAFQRFSSLSNTRVAYESFCGAAYEFGKTVPACSFVLFLKSQVLALSDVYSNEIPRLFVFGFRSYGGWTDACSSNVRIAQTLRRMELDKVVHVFVKKQLMFMGIRTDDEDYEEHKAELYEYAETDIRYVLAVRILYDRFLDEETLSKAAERRMNSHGRRRLRKTEGGIV